MQRPVDRRAFVRNIVTQTTYENELDGGIYLGFLIEGHKVLLSRVDERGRQSAPVVVARSVSSLLR
jgi:hypothetical protein